MRAKTGGCPYLYAADRPAAEDKGGEMRAKTGGCPYLYYL